MLMDLQELLGREVDLIVEGTLRPYAAETANRDKILIYERERGLPFLMILKMPWNKSGGLANYRCSGNRKSAMFSGVTT